MSTQEDYIPGWLNWVVPIFTALGAAVVIIRKLLSQAVREDFQAMLDEKHQENAEKFDEIDRQLADARAERLEMRRELARVAQDVAYLRGTTTGTMKQLREKP